MIKIRWIKNLIGSFKGYKKCQKCKDSYYWKKPARVFFDKGCSISALCEECFNKLSFLNVEGFYEDSLNRFFNELQSVYTKNKIEQVRKTLQQDLALKKNSVDINSLSISDQASYLKRRIMIPSEEELRELEKESKVM